MTISLPPKGNADKVLGSYFTPLRASAQATPNMTVQVAAGSFWLADNTHQEYIGGTTPTIFAPVIPSTAKWVVVTVTKDGVLNNVDGVPAASPVLPDPSEYTDELPLAAIFLTDTTTIITSEMVYDIRPLWSVPVDSISQAQLDDFATIVYVNNQLAAKADITGTPNATFTLNDTVLTGTINYSSFMVNRFSGADVGIRFNETAGSPPGSDPHWEFTNDGVAWDHLGVASDAYYTKIESDARFAEIAHTTDMDLHMSADQNTFFDGLTLTGSPALTASDVNQLIGVTGNVQGQFDTHLADMDVHMSTDQNVFLDGLLLGGSPLSLQAADVNQLIGITSNVQTQLDAKLDDVTGDADNLASLDGAGELQDSGVAVDNVGTTAADLWTGDKLSTLLTASAVFDDLTDVSVAAPVLDDMVQWNGANWVNVDILTVMGGDFVRKSGSVVESITGVKTFSDDVVMSGSLTINGTDTTLLTANLNVEDTNITLNFGDTGIPTSPSHGSGLTVNRGSVGTASSLIWNDTTERWHAGLVGAEEEIVLVSDAVRQPFYELFSAAVGSPPVGSPPAGAAIYVLGFDVPMPTGSPVITAAIQVFVNGIKQIEGVGKSYTVAYGVGSPQHVVVTFNAGSEPSTAADVEFYGFGYNI